MTEPASFTQWREARHAYVTAPTGNLALVDYQAVTEAAEPVRDWPATVRRVAGEAGVRIVAAAADQVLADGAPIDGEVFVARLGGDGRPLISWGTQSADAFSLDGSDYELRFYDSASDGLENFDGIEYYDYDPGLVVPAILKPYETTGVVPWEFTRASDTGHTKRVPGVLALELRGEQFELLAFLDNDVLVLTFADGTTGKESYAPSRFLKLDPPGPDGALVADFNLAIIPPCGFSNFYSCPLAPLQNRLTVPVRAGEKIVRWKRPRY